MQGPRAVLRPRSAARPEGAPGSVLQALAGVREVPTQGPALCALRRARELEDEGMGRAAALRHREQGRVFRPREPHVQHATLFFGLLGRQRVERRGEVDDGRRGVLTTLGGVDGGQRDRRTGRRQGCRSCRSARPRDAGEAAPGVGETDGMGGRRRAGGRPRRRRGRRVAPAAWREAIRSRTVMAGGGAGMRRRRRPAAPRRAVPTSAGRARPRLMAARARRACRRPPCDASSCSR